MKAFLQLCEKFKCCSVWKTFLLLFGNRNHFHGVKLLMHLMPLEWSLAFLFPFFTKNLYIEVMLIFFAFSSCSADQNRIERKVSARQKRQNFFSLLNNGLVFHTSLQEEALAISHGTIVHSHFQSSLSTEPYPHRWTKALHRRSS